MKIHESSPGGVSSTFIKKNTSHYVPTHYFPGVEAGSFQDGIRCENLEAMTFDDESFDLMITQDVMEHVFCPQSAFAEIARTLKTGGAHVFTVPFYQGRETKIRARLSDGGIEYLDKPDYHGNPIDKKGSLVTREWGDDLMDLIGKWSGLTTERYTFSDRRLGLEAEFLDVFVSWKITNVG